MGVEGGVEEWGWSEDGSEGLVTWCGDGVGKHGLLVPVCERTGYRLLSARDMYRHVADDVVSRY